MSSSWKWAVIQKEATILYQKENMMRRMVSRAPPNTMSLSQSARAPKENSRATKDEKSVTDAKLGMASVVVEFAPSPTVELAVWGPPFKAEKTCWAMAK